MPFSSSVAPRRGVRSGQLFRRRANPAPYLHFSSCNSQFAIPTWPWLRPCRSVLLCAHLWLAGTAALGATNAWPSPAAGGRLRIEKASDSPWPAKVGEVELCPCRTNPVYYSIFTTDGKPVGAQTYWSAPYEPIKIHFDTSSGQTSYDLYLEPTAPTRLLAWKPEAGVLLETRQCQKGPLDTWPQVRRLLTQAATVYGRSYVPNIFLGVNPHGPSGYYVAVFSAFFTAPQGGDYGFATASSDASYLEVDGRVVAEWLGRHDAWGGVRAEHRGIVRLAAGVHRLQYVQIQFDGRSAAVAAWNPPGQKQFVVMPPAAFAPVARFRATSYEPGPGPTNALYFDWRSIEHNLVDDLAWVKVRFRVLSPQERRTHRWRFDDGAEATGASVEHLFVRPGNRRVTLEALDGSRRVAVAAATVRVEPHWAQMQEWRPELFAAQKRELLARDLQAAPLADLVAIAHLAARVEDDQLLARVAQVCLRRQSEFSSTQADLFYTLGLHFVGRGNPGDELAEKALRVALPLSANTTALHDRVRLRLAAVLVECGGSLDEAQSLLKAMGTTTLSAEDHRLRQLLLADALAAQGEVDKARAAYHAVGARVAPARKDAQVKRLARLEGANHLLRRGELEDAERILRQMEFDDPLERLSLDTGLPLIRVYLARGETRRALAHCQRRARGAAEHPQAPELYYALAEAGFAAGQPAPAQAAVRKLLREFPYSEAAARAKEAWPALAAKAP